MATPKKKQLQRGVYKRKDADLYAIKWTFLRNGYAEWSTLFNLKRVGKTKADRGARKRKDTHIEAVLFRWSFVTPVEFPEGSQP